jgi:hypothetical protein
MVLGHFNPLLTTISLVSLRLYIISRGLFWYFEKTTWTCSATSADEFFVRFDIELFLLKIIAKIQFIASPITQVWRILL